MWPVSDYELWVLQKKQKEKDNLQEDCYTKLHLSKKTKLIKEPNAQVEHNLTQAFEITFWKNKKKMLKMGNA